ncbi:Chemotaxis response regulator protein-glutamate methylesterase [compost metagenome]
MSRPIKVLVVDDSPFMRRAITRMITSEPGIEIIGQATNGAEAIALITELRPDVVTMDIEMPVMDGLTALKRIMTERPLPVIMMSTLTQTGSSATLQALELGAFDFVPKPESSMLDVFSVQHELTSKIKEASRPRRTGPLPPLPTPSAAPAKIGEPRASQRIDLIAIGISTGGPPALQAVLPQLPSDLPVPVLVVQHMPPGFTRSLAERLDKLSGVRVKEAEQGEKLEAATVYIAPAGWHLTLKSDSRGTFVQLIDSSDSKTWHKPSVDVMMASVAMTYGSRALGLIMTGMGNDGTAGAGAMKRAGAPIWAQDEESCVVYGMPRAVFEAGVVDKVLPLPRIATELARIFRPN